jgi:hypothetical protein
LYSPVGLHFAQLSFIHDLKHQCGTYEYCLFLLLSVLYFWIDNVQ